MKELKEVRTYTVNGRGLKIGDEKRDLGFKSIVS